METLIDVIDSLNNGDIEEYLRMDSERSGQPETEVDMSNIDSLLDRISETSGDDEIPSGQIPRPGSDDREPIGSNQVYERQPDSREFESAVDRLFGTMQRSSGRYISDVFQCDSQTEAERFCRLVRDDALNGYRGGFFIVVRDGTHCHVVHICNFNAGYCRCAFIQKAKSRAELRRPNSKHRRKYARNLTRADISRILFYFISKGRKPEDVFFISGRMERFPSEDFSLPLQEYQESPGRKEFNQMETRFSLSDFELLETQQIRDSLDEIHRSRSKRDIVKGKGGKAEIQRCIINLCQTYPSSPIVSIINKKEWIQDPVVQFMRNDNKLVQNVLDTWSHTINKWSIQDFIKLYEDPNCFPYFDSDDKDYYLSIDESMIIIQKLLQYQFNDNELAIYDFICDIYDICERKVPKLNSILIHSPPSAGKNFFFDMIMSFYLNKGQMGNPNKHNNFAFQECFNKRIILWNEPNYESGSIEKLKMILGGDNYTVNVKCKADAAVHRTPVIILTNNIVSIMNDPAFKDRMIKYTWKPAPFLKDISKKPNPLTYIYLLKQYNIINDQAYTCLFLNSLSISSTVCIGRRTYFITLQWRRFIHLH